MFGGKYWRRERSRPLRQLSEQRITGHLVPKQVRDDGQELTCEPLMLRRDLAREVLKLPRRIGEDRPELLPRRRSEQVDCGLGERRFREEHNEILTMSSSALGRRILRHFSRHRLSPAQPQNGRHLEVICGERSLAPQLHTRLSPRDEDYERENSHKQAS